MTFLDSAYIYGIIGAFLGISLTVEKKCGVWWEGSIKNRLFKSIIAFLLGLAYIILFSIKYFLLKNIESYNHSLIIIFIF